MIFKIHACSHAGAKYFNESNFTNLSQSHGDECVSCMGLKINVSCCMNRLFKKNQGARNDEQHLIARSTFSSYV